jgi:hypothetical protein
MPMAETADGNSATMNAAEIERELKDTDAATQTDYNAELLPFNNLGGSRFELLIYLLIAAENSAASVTLLKAFGDRGRDVLISEGGRLSHIVQCKNLQDRLTEPGLVYELLKLALHAYIDEIVLPSLNDGGKPITVEIWAPSGITEPASHLVDTWPNGWTEARLQDAFQEIKETYAKFAHLEWDHVRTTVVDKFPSAVRIRKVTGVDISMRIRGQAPIYSRFFRGGIFASLEDVEQVITAAIAGAHWRQVDDKNIRRLLDRMSAFPNEQRLFLGQGYVLGMNPAFLARLSREEFKEVAKLVTMPVAELSKLTMQAAQRIVSAIIEERRPAFNTVQNKSLSLMVMQYAVQKFVVGQRSRGFPVALAQNGPLPTKIESFDRELSRLARDNWNGFHAVLAPTFVPPTQDSNLEALRKEVARHAVSGYASLEDFEQTAKDGYLSLKETINQLLAQLDDLLPKDLLVVSDLASAFNSKELLTSMGETLRTIESQRSKVKGPT